MISFRHLWNALQERRYQVRRQFVDYPFIRNANNVDESDMRWHALFIFLAEPFIMKPSNPRFHNHQNLKQSLQMVRALGEAGFSVDVADVKSSRALPAAHYDLVISHRSDLVANGLLRRGGKKVYLATGMNHDVFNRNLRRRYQRLNARRNCDLVPENLNDERMVFVRASDAVVGFGNRFTAGTWSSVINGPVMEFNNYGSFQGGFLTRDWNVARKNFLFYAGRLQIVRGLDLLLDMFPRHPDLHLYICSGFKHEEPFRRCYQRELFRTPNIHPIGLVSKGERRFVEIVRRCGFVILPSCSDCQPGSVIEGMHAGLIPLVTKETGLDVGDAGTVLRSDSEEDIAEAILRASNLDEATLATRSRMASDLVTRHYSEHVFVDRWKLIAGELARIVGVQ